MDIDAVIEKGERLQAHNTDENFEHLYYEPLIPETIKWRSLIFLLVIIFLAVVVYHLTGFKYGFNLFFGCIGMWLFVSTIEDIRENKKINKQRVNYWEEKRRLEREIENWKYNIAKPYIKSLPMEKKEIIFIKFESDLRTKGSENHWYINFNETQRIPLTILFNDEKVVTIVDSFVVTMDLNTESEPYIEFQRLPLNLGHGIKAGYYNATVHLPKNYKFTDIK